MEGPDAVAVRGAATAGIRAHLRKTVLYDSKLFLHVFSLSRVPVPDCYDTFRSAHIYPGVSLGAQRPPRVRVSAHRRAHQYRSPIVFPVFPQCHYIRRCGLPDGQILPAQLANKQA